MYGQRTIPALLDFCRDIREVSEPGAKMLNYANPMAMNTWAAIEHGKVDTIGLCHGVQNGWRQIAERARRKPSQRGGLHLHGHQPPDLVYRHSLSRAPDRSR